jgi:hypothetical protein
MNKILLSLVSLCIIKMASAQISLNEGDFAFEGENVLTSNAIIPDSLNYRQTGPNFTWDFSTLQPAWQNTVNYLDVANTGVEYAAVFGDLSSVPADLAINAPDVSLNLILYNATFSDVYDFYAVGPNNYLQVGWGGTIENLPLPTLFSQLDTIYRFPVNYGNTDSCISGFTTSVSGYIYYSQIQKRVDTVDGWGQLTTPYGTFPVLRMVTNLYTFDSIYVDTLHEGSSTSTFTQQYKWFGNNQEGPLLQVNTTPNGPGQQPTINSITYRDSSRVTAIAPLAANGFALNIYPNPAHSLITVSRSGNTGGTSLMTITDMTGKTILGSPLLQDRQNFDISGWAKGIYFVTVTSDNQKLVRKLVLD